MDVLKLIGVLIVVVGFALRFDTIATVVVAGIVTGLVAGLDFMQILDILGSAFITQRTATLFVLTLPVIGVCERYGLKDKAIDFIRKLKNATAGKILDAYLTIRSLAAAFSLRLGGHPQFVRPLIVPMAEAAAQAQNGSLGEDESERIKGYSAANENFGNFFAQNCFMGSAGTLLIVSTLVEQGIQVDALQIALMSIPVAVIAVVMGIVNNHGLDRWLKRRAAGSKKEAE